MTTRGGKEGDLNKETYIDSFPGKLGTAMLGVGGGGREERGGRGVEQYRYSKGGKRRQRFKRRKEEIWDIETGLKT